MIHLNTQTDFSFLKAYGSVEQVCQRAKQIGSDTLGIADFGGCWGHIPFWKECKKNDIKPLFGVQLAVVPIIDPDSKDARFDIVTLIAKNNTGLKEQYEIVSEATAQFYFRPRVTWGQLKKLKHNYTIVNRISHETKAYISLLRTPLIAAVPEPGILLNLVLEETYPVVIAISPVYPSPEHRESYQLVNAIGSGRKVSDIPPVDTYMMREGELRSKFAELGVDNERFSAWIERTGDIGRNCKVSPRIGKNVKPVIDRSVEEWCVDGARLRGIDLSIEPYASRYEREIALIYEKGFQDYFLLIADLIQWAKQRMFVGPARGSSAGSLVCFLMEIVEIDPLRYDLLFERFIDINREDLPDIDIDFPDDKRDQVFDYIVEKYGADKVARIGTVSVFRSKSALNDVAKSYSVPSWEIKKLTEIMIERSGGDARANMVIEDTIAQFEIGKKLVEEFPKIKMASKIEGHPRHTGKHAAGVIVADKPVNTYFAVNRREGSYIGQINKYDAESIGLLKIDALGLKTLSVIEDCCEAVGLDPRFLYSISTDKKEAFKVFQTDKVAGIFQFEGYAVRSLMRQMGVHEFNDIVALTALARPGPLHCGAANEFIARKTGATDWDYFIEEMIPHTKHTYGTIVYQEQVMSITRDLGDMSWQDVSALRKAMSRSLGEEFFNQFRDKFMKGTKKRGIDDVKALTLWNEMCTFGSWAFNLSHAVSYASISYWCAYLKSKYPMEFAVAHLRRTDSTDHVLRLLRELVKEGIEIVPFDLERSQESWSTYDNKIYGGFLAVKGVGPVAAAKFHKKRFENLSLDGEWYQALTPKERQKLLAPNNTPWHNLNRLHKDYGDIYDNPDKYNIGGEVIDIEQITEKKGNYCFIGTIKQRNLRDLNETQSLAKRNGKRVWNNELFLNLVVEDDTSSILCSIDRWRYPDIGLPIMEQEADGKDFLIRGEIYSDGWRKINIKKIRRLSDDDDTGSSGDKRDGHEEAQGAREPENVHQSNDANDSAAV